MLSFSAHNCKTFVRHLFLDVFPEATLKRSEWFPVSFLSVGGLLYQLIEVVLCFWPRWLSHGPNGFQLGLCVCIKSSSGKVAAKSNHLVKPSCRGGVRWRWTRKTLENLAQDYGGGLYVFWFDLKPLYNMFFSCKNMVSLKKDIDISAAKLAAGGYFGTMWPVSQKNICQFTWTV